MEPYVIPKEPFLWLSFGIKVAWDIWISIHGIQKGHPDYTHVPYWS